MEQNILVGGCGCYVGVLTVPGLKRSCYVRVKRYT